MAEECAGQKGDTANCTACWILTESQEFIRRTFAFLPAKTLGICSRVCKAWHAEVKRVLHHREEIGWATFGRIQAEDAIDIPPDPLGPFGVNLNGCLDTIGSLPRLAIMFSQCLSLADFRKSQYFPDFDSDDDDDDDEAPTLSRGRRELDKSLEVVHSRLPIDSSIIFVHTDGTIGCQSDLSPAGESEGNLGVSCVLLPGIEGVTVDYQLHSLDCLTASDIKAYTQSHRMPADTQCILVIYDDAYRVMSSYVRHLQRDFYDEFGTLPVVSGGIARQVFVDSNDRTLHSSSGLLTIAFSGPKVKAASVVLDRRISTRRKAHAKILELKKAGLSEKRSLAFMFSCVGRGQRFYQEEDVESGVFHEIFPNTPLLGFFGGGEYGCDNLNCGKAVRDDEADDNAKAYGKRKEQNKLPNLELSLTCVLCLLSFG